MAAEKTQFQMTVIRAVKVDGKPTSPGDVITVDRTTRDILLGSRKARDFDPSKDKGGAKKS